MIMTIKIYIVYVQMLMDVVCFQLFVLADVAKNLFVLFHPMAS